MNESDSAGPDQKGPSTESDTTEANRPSTLLVKEEGSVVQHVADEERVAELSTTHKTVCVVLDETSSADTSRGSHLFLRFANIQSMS